MPDVKREAAPYAQIAQHFREQIHSGELGPGERLPSVRDIAAEWKVSRATADKALSALRSEGLVTAMVGIGTVVTMPVPTVQTGISRFRRMLAVGTTERSEIVSAELAPPPTAVAQFFDMTEGNLITRKRRFVGPDGAVTTLSTSWLWYQHADKVPGLLSTESLADVGGTIGAVRVATGRQPGAATDTAYSRLATDDEAEQLGLTQPAAVMVVEARLYDEDGVPLEFGIDVVGPNQPWSVGADLSLL